MKAAKQLQKRYGNLIQFFGWTYPEGGGSTQQNDLGDFHLNIVGTYAECVKKNTEKVDFVLAFRVDVPDSGVHTERNVNKVVFGFEQSIPALKAEDTVRGPLHTGIMKWVEMDKVRRIPPPQFEDNVIVFRKGHAYPCLKPQSSPVDLSTALFNDYIEAAKTGLVLTFVKDNTTGKFVPDRPMLELSKIITKVVRNAYDDFTENDVENKLYWYIVGPNEDKAPGVEKAVQELMEMQLGWILKHDIEPIYGKWQGKFLMFMAIPLYFSVCSLVYCYYRYTQDGPEALSPWVRDCLNRYGGARNVQIDMTLEDTDASPTYSATPTGRSPMAFSSMLSETVKFGFSKMSSRGRPKVQTKQEGTIELPLKSAPRETE